MNLGLRDSLIDETANIYLPYLYQAYLVKGNGEANLLDQTYYSPSPSEFAMMQNRPNPFNSATAIEYQVPNEEINPDVRLIIYNVLGQSVKVLHDGPTAPGIYTAYWDGTDNSGRNVASGIYLYQLTVGQHGQTKKMILLK